MWRMPTWGTSRRPNSPKEGVYGFNVETNSLEIFDGITWQTKSIEDTKSITVESPTSSEDVTLFYATKDINITQIAALVIGSTPSVTWTIRFSSNRADAGTEVVTGGTTTTSSEVVTAFDDATIPSGSWVWLETTTTSGTVTQLHLTLGV